MASRNILHRSKLENFKEYLVSKGWVIQDTKGIYEALRAVNPDVMKRPLIIYSGKSKEHLSVDDRDSWIVRDYINHRGDEAVYVEVVLKIPEEIYEGLVYLDIFEVRNLIQKGTLLPEGHGRLGDLDHYQERLKVKYNECDAMTGSGILLAYEMAYGEPTIIEADKGSK